MKAYNFKEKKFTPKNASQNLTTKSNKKLNNNFNSNLINTTPDFLNKNKNNCSNFNNNDYRDRYNKTCYKSFPISKDNTLESNERTQISNFDRKWSIIKGNNIKRCTTNLIKYFNTQRKRKTSKVLIRSQKFPI